MSAVRQFLYGDANPFTDAATQPLDLQGWNSESSVFQRLIAETGARNICEVGTWKGASAIHMAKLGAETIVCVDTWLGSLEFYTDLNKRGLLQPRNGRPGIYEVFLSNAIQCGVTDILVPFPSTSRMASEIFHARQFTFDLIYIDASHETLDVIEDISRWIALSPVIFGDDWDWPTVRLGVTHAAKKFDLQIETENEKWILRK